MDVPDLVRQELGDEEIRAGVSLGEDDAVCFTPTRTLVYRGEGLLSDEGVSTYPLDFERLSVSEGRRKTSFTLTYVDRQTEFSVPGDRTDAVLERLLEGGLRVSDVIDENESVEGVYRFSELTLVVAQRRLIKHVGEYTWDGDFEAYPYEEVTALDFEEGSVATALVLEAGDRSERIKAPNDKAPVVRQTLEEALFAFHGVDSLSALNDHLADATEDTDDEQSGSEGLGLESGIDPLVGDSDDKDESSDATRTADTTETESAARETAEPTDVGSVADAESATAEPRDATRRSERNEGAETADELAQVQAQLEELTEAVEQQNELLARQQKTVKQLIRELRQGRG